MGADANACLYLHKSTPQACSNTAEAIAVPVGEEAAKSGCAKDKQGGCPKEIRGDGEKRERNYQHLNCLDYGKNDTIQGKAGH